MRSGALALLALLAVLVTTPLAVAQEGPVFTFADPRISESSGLVDLGALMVTTNDSGDSARVFVVDPATGETVGVTEIDADSVDVEALAPAGRRAVWVGDIGDNREVRDEVTVHRVPVAARDLAVGSPTSYRLAYPDGAHDAESLLATESGRLYVITKSFRGGTVYRAPATLSRSGVNRLEAVAEVEEYATDAALLREGRFAVVRGLGRASVYTFPDFGLVGTFPLPPQRQGEGLSVGPRDRVRISTEGVGTTVTEVRLPPELVRSMRSPTPETAAPVAPAQAESSNTWLAWALAGAAVLVALAVALGLARRSG